MKPCQLLGVDPAEPSPSRPHPVGLPRARGGLSLLLLAFGLSLIFLSSAYAADGDLDPSFITGPGPYAGVQDIPAIRGQVYYNTGGTFNGYSLLFGSFFGMTVGGISHPTAIARLTNLGALDTSFTCNQIAGEVRSVYIYPHDDPHFPDQILIGGDFTAFTPTVNYKRFARLNTDGSVDTSFPRTFQGEGAVNAIERIGSGDTAKILVGGYSLKPGGDDPGPFYHLVRLNFDGGLDSSFTHWGAPGGYISDIKLFSGDPVFGNGVRIWCSYPKNPDGSGGTYYLLLLNSNATFPSPSNPPLAFIGDETVDGPLFNKARQSDGKYVICGQFQKVYNPATQLWVPRNRVARLGSDLKTLDTSYDVGVGPNDMVTQVNPMSSSNNRMVLSGNFSTWNGASRGYLVRLNTTGTLDSAFNSVTGADDRIMRVNWTSNGSGGLIYGYFRSYNGKPRGGIASVDGNGNLLSTFANITPNLGIGGGVLTMASQSDGKIIIGGGFNGVGGKYRGNFARLNPDGSLDTSFKGGVVGWVRSVALQADGKILVAGNFGQCQGYARTSLARLNPDGSLDTAFNPKLGAGYKPYFELNQVVPLSNGQIMLAGDIKTADHIQVPAVRLNSDGTLDSSFNTSGFSLPGMDWWCGKRLAVVGSKYLIAGTYDTPTAMNGGGYLARFTYNGAVDNDFGPNIPPAHIQTMDGGIDDLLLQPDGKIVVSGIFTHVIDGSGSPPARSAIARFSANGSLDNTFTPNIPPPPNANAIEISGMARQSDGKILIAGFSFYNNNYVSSAVARLHVNGFWDSTFNFGNPTNGGNWAGINFLRLPGGKALIGGCYGSYNGAPAWSLVRIFAGPANFNPGNFLLLLGD